MDLVKTLVALISTGKGTWGHVGRLISEEWDKIIIVTNDFGREKFNPSKEVDWIVVNPSMPIENIKNAIRDRLPKEIGDEIYVSLISGSGKEHMALLSLLKDMDKDYRFVSLTMEGIGYF
ncbi:hypothetical protein KBB69_02940 [Candidatus Dojkabacteria bacterium]|jgi:hypothetical protein|nr:hypothetical protein [Candidatus Dojkabacteria bacterium]OQC18112.1 MAG: hypothetical protein BWX72_00267 [Firmicutes bacterium ADurb.Bin080]HOC78355.1 hypothetical protein [Methanofastidiosum sp.]HQQ49034.1 hypothetical protein [Methanofastidiosum sp.]HRZ18791.1 hypothetical protein [Methanofastidiosum sp.]